MKKTMVLLLGLVLYLGKAAAEEPAVPEQLIPVSAARAVQVENENAGVYLFYVGGKTEPIAAYVIPDDTARLRLEITASDNPERMVFGGAPGEAAAVMSLLDPERGAFVCEQPVPDDSEGTHFTAEMLYDRELGNQDPDLVICFLVTDEAYIGEVADNLRQRGYPDVRRETGDADRAAEPLYAYILHVADQDNNPVPEVYVNFCTDTACTMVKSDKNGTVTFEAAPDIYHIQLLKVPEGYSFRTDTDMYTGRVYGEWLLRVRRN